MTAAVRVSNLTKSYRQRSQLAVDHVSFCIEQGEIVGLLGPNGAGKTTLIKMLSGVVPTTEGRGEVLGYDLLRDNLQVKNLIGVAHQRLTFDLFLTGYDNLQIAATFKRLRWADVKPKADKLLEAFGLTGEKLTVPVFTLSGGEMRRLQVVRALLKNPKLLLLDEPSAGLDVSGRRQVWSLLQELRDNTGATIIWTSHYVEELERNCSKIIILNKGRLVCLERTQALVEEYSRPRIVIEFPDRVDELVGNLVSIATCGLRTKVDGKRVEILTDGRPDPLPGILSSLRDDGLSPSDIRILPESLEDAFLTLLRRDDNDGGA